MVKICAVCKSEHERRGAKFCSHECFSAHRKNYQREKGKSIRNMTERICPYCSSKHLRNKNQKGNFCNRSCGAKFYIENGRSDEWRLRKNPKLGLHVPCVVCKKGNFYVKLVHIAADHRKTCSKACHASYMSWLWKFKGAPSIGMKSSEESKQKQRDTWMKKYGVPNAFLIKNQGGKSKLAKDFFDLLKIYVSNDLEYEQLIESRYFADIRVKNEKILIEFYGDYWHANPELYEDSFWNDRKKMYANEIRNRDDERKKWLEERGYRVIVIWERDWKLQRKEVFDFLKWSISI